MKWLRNPKIRARTGDHFKDEIRTSGLARRKSVGAHDGGSEWLDVSELRCEGRSARAAAAGYSARGCGWTSGLAVKILHGTAINRSVAGEDGGTRLRRRLAGRGDAGSEAADFARELTLRVTPLLGEETGTGWTPRSLQIGSASIPATDSWKLVKEIAAALARHARPAGGPWQPQAGQRFLRMRSEVLLTDWALGNMPGIRPVPSSPTRCSISRRSNCGSRTATWRRQATGGMFSRSACRVSAADRAIFRAA